MRLDWRIMMALLAALPGCVPVEPSGPAPAPSATLAPASPAASATASAPGGTPTPLPPVLTDGPTPVPSPVATSAYNALFTLGKAWHFDQTVTTGGKETRSRVRVVVVEVAATEATIAVQEEPFPS